MKKRVMGMLLILALLNGPWSGGANAMDKKAQAIVLVSAALREEANPASWIFQTEKMLRTEMPEWDVKTIFIPLGEQSDAAALGTDALTAALQQKLPPEGMERLLIQPLELMENERWERLKRIVEVYREKISVNHLLLGKPLLTEEGEPGAREGYLGFVFAVKGEMTRLQCCNGVIFVSPNSTPRQAAILSALQRNIDASGFGNLYIFSADDPPGTLLRRIRAKRLKKVTVLPCELEKPEVDSSEGWREKLQARLQPLAGKIEMEWRGLGESVNVQQLFLNRVREALEPLTVPETAGKILPTLRQISSFDALALWKNGQGVWIDVRTREEYRQGHVPGAVSIPLEELEERRKEIPQTTTVLLVCGQGIKSAKANLLLQKNGWTNTYSVADGMSGWQDRIEK